jgi:stage II sporulation protein D
MHRLSLLAVVLAALAFSSSAAASTRFVVDGRGWGHGVGMSQWGAQGKALRGATYREILHFYYQGTTVDQTDRRRVRVLLTSGRNSVALSSDAPFKMGNKTLAAHTVYNVVVSNDGQVRIVGLGKFGNPATVTRTRAFLRLRGSPYRGDFKVWVRGGKLAVVNVVRIQGYLYGVVPREMPAWFELEALKAQADAARSYAVRAHRADWFDLYATTSDQVYGGACAGCEQPRSTQAVDATKGEVVKYGSAVAQTFFSSSNGGYEAASGDVFVTQLPYLRARPDADDLTRGNPNRYWKDVFSPRRIARQIGMPRPTDVTVARDGSRRAKTVTFSNTSGTLAFAGTTVESKLGLRSRRYWIGVQSITSNRTNGYCRQRVRLAAFVHRVGSFRIQRRSVKASAWTNMTLTDAGSSHWTASHRPCVSTDYRLISRKTTNPLVHVAVSPQVGIETVRPSYLAGHVNPLLPGVAVAIQRHTAAGWKKVTTTTIRDDGSFRANFTLAEARYRAKVVPPASTGLVRGYSPPVTVTFH